MTTRSSTACSRRPLGGRNPTPSSATPGDERTGEQPQRAPRRIEEAERASVKLYAQVFFRGREVIEEGYATGLFKSGMSVIVPRYGIESFLHVMDKQPSGQPSPFKMDPDEKAMSQATSIRFARSTASRCA